MWEFDLLARAGEIDMSRLYGWRAILREINDYAPEPRRLELDDPVYASACRSLSKTPPQSLQPASCSSGAVAATVPKKRRVIHYRDVSLSELMSPTKVPEPIQPKISDEERAFRVVRDHPWRTYPGEFWSRPATKVKYLIKLVDELDAQGLRRAFISAVVSGRIILDADLKSMLPSVLVVYFGDAEMRILLRRSAAGGSC